MKKFLVFATGVWVGFIGAAVMKNVTFHTGTCEENIASWNTWGQDTKGQTKTEDGAK